MYPLNTISNKGKSKGVLKELLTLLYLRRKLWLAYIIIIIIIRGRLLISAQSSVMKPLFTLSYRS